MCISALQIIDRPCLVGGNESTGQYTCLLVQTAHIINKPPNQARRHLTTYTTLTAPNLDKSCQPYMNIAISSIHVLTYKWGHRHSVRYIVCIFVRLNAFRLKGYIILSVTFLKVEFIYGFKKCAILLASCTRLRLL